MANLINVHDYEYKNGNIIYNFRICEYDDVFNNITSDQMNNDYIYNVPLNYKIPFISLYTAYSDATSLTLEEPDYKIVSDSGDLYISFGDNLANSLPMYYKNTGPYTYRPKLDSIPFIFIKDSTGTYYPANKGSGYVSCTAYLIDNIASGDATYRPANIYTTAYATDGFYLTNSLQYGYKPDQKSSNSTAIPLNMPLTDSKAIGIFCGYQEPAGQFVSEISNYVNFLLKKATEIDFNNPYPGGDEPSQPGDGEFDYGGDGVDIPELPSISVCDSGFVTLYAPTDTQLKELSAFLWSDNFSLDSFKKLFNNPMDCILGLSIIPVNVPTGSAQEITVGNIVSTVSCNIITQQFVSVDCGTLKISPTKFSGSYLDYAPYVKCYIYLPFIGIQQINIDDVMNSTVHVVYHVDLLTGAMCCYVEVQNRTTGGVKQKNTVLYTFMGQCAESVPLSATSFSNTIGSILTAAASVGGVVATAMSGGAAAPAAAAMLAGATTATANAATSLKPNIQHSGSMGGSSGMMSIKYPFMIFDAPHTSIPSKQYQYTGFPSNKIVKLSSLSGFNVIQAINLKVDGANGVEMQEIKSKLESGVII